MRKVKLISLLLAIIFSFSSLALPCVAFASDGCVKGIDVSEHNIDTDFAALKSQGFDFVMIRIGYYNHIDNLFYENVRKACEAGMSFGVYLYSYAFTNEEAQIEADFVVNTLSTLPAQYRQNMTLPVAYDLEDKLIIENGCGYNEITQHALVFTDTIRANSYDAMVYANNNWFENYIDTSLLYQNGVKLWYAYYTDDESASVKTIGNTLIPCYMWQYTSQGIDQNILYIDYSGVSISLSKTEYTYNGKAKTPDVNVVFGDGTPVPSGLYSVSYSKNINTGKAVVTVNLAGGYPESISTTFIIAPKKQKLTSVKAYKKKLTVKWSKDKLVSGYQLQYSTSSKFTKSKTKTVSVSKKNTTKTIKSLKAGKKYYVRLRAYKTIDGNKVYSDWSKVKSVNVK